MKRLVSPHNGFRALAYPKGSITQFFAENPKLYKDCCGIIGHNGIDSVAPWGTPIRAVSKQKVVEVKEDSGGYGKKVVCIDDDYEYIYGHLSEISVELGQQLEAGQQLGRMGNTGFVVSGATPFWKSNPFAGTHLHLTMKKIKRWTSEPTWNTSYPTGDRAITANVDNGFNGAVDPLIGNFIEPSFEENIIGAQLTLISLINRLIRLSRIA